MENDLIILKFGSSVLREPEDVRSAVHEIYRYARRGMRVIAVVSAMGDETDRLLRQAKNIAPDASGSLLASYLASAEQKSAALLTMFVERVGLSVSLLDPRDVSFTIKGSHRDGEPANIDKAILQARLKAFGVVVFPGFFGIGEDGQLSLLGRGGSDLTAIFLASKLAANECRLIKDVDGLYEWDPALEGPKPRKYANASWDDAIRVAGKLVQPKAIDYARRHHYPIKVSCAGSKTATIIGEGPSELAEENARPPLRVVLLGLGTVGYGIYQHLARDPHRFEVVKIVVRSPEKYADLGIPAALFSTDANQALSPGADLLVETIGGIDPALLLVKAALAHAIPVVTANKDMVADHGILLKDLSEENNTNICYSSAIGGGLFALEAVEQARGQGVIRRIDGILNGTCNFILHQMDQGADFTAALNLAQEKGYAEANPARDLAGLDAAAKISILARHAFGLEIEPGNLEIEAIDGTRPPTGPIRQIASCWLENGVAQGCIRLLPLDRGDDLAGTKGAENWLVITMESGNKRIVSGMGAGRWPTAESVFADIMDIQRNAGGGSLEARTGIEPVYKDLQSSA